MLFGPTSETGIARGGQVEIAMPGGQTALCGENLPLARTIQARTGDPMLLPLRTIGIRDADEAMLCVAIHSPERLPDGRHRIRLSFAHDGLPLTMQTLIAFPILLFERENFDEILIALRTEDLVVRRTLQRLGFRIAGHESRLDGERTLFALSYRDLPDTYRSWRASRLVTILN